MPHRWEVHKFNQYNDKQRMSRANFSILHSIYEIVIYFRFLIFILWFYRRLMFHITRVISTNNTRAQKWLVIAHYVVSVSTRSTLRGAKHFSCSYCGHFLSYVKWAVEVAIFQLDSLNWYLYCLWVLFNAILYFMHFAELRMLLGRRNIRSVRS